MAKDTEECPEMYEVNWNGKTHYVTREDYEKVRDGVFGELKPYVDALNKSFAVNRKIHEGYLETAEIKQGYLKAVSLMIVIKVGNIKFPDASLSGKCSSALSNLNRAMGGKKIMDAAPALEAAETALNAYQNDTFRFLAELSGTAWKVGTTLQVTTTAGFTVLDVMAAAPLAAGLGLTAAQALVASAAGVKVLQSAGEELGKAASGQDVSVWESVGKVVVDGVVAAAVAGVVPKFDAKLVGSLAKSLVGKLGSKVSFCTAPQVEEITVKYLTTSAGQVILGSAATSAVEQAGDIAKKGKVPGADDVVSFLEKTLIGTLSAGLVKNVDAATKKIADKALPVFLSTLVPDAVKKLVSGAAPSSADAKKIAEETHKALKDEITKTGVIEMVTAMKGDESADALATLAVKTMDRNTLLKKLIEDEVKAQLKKKKIPVK